MSKIPLDSASKMVKIGIYTINCGGGEIITYGRVIYLKDRDAYRALDTKLDLGVDIYQRVPLACMRMATSMMT